VDTSYPYNAIFGRGFFNTFEAALHAPYLCLKVPAAIGVITIHDNQKDARNIEQGFTPGHRNVNYLQDEKAENGSNTAKGTNEGTFVGKPIEPEYETRKVPLDPRVPDKAVMISQDLSSNKEASCFHSWIETVMSLHGKPLISQGSTDIIEHKL
jgi:hypothetical protein